jgi:hypothetical protein
MTFISRISSSQFADVLVCTGLYYYTFSVPVRTGTYKYVPVRTKYPVPVQWFRIPDDIIGNIIGNIIALKKKLVNIIGNIIENNRK